MKITIVGGGPAGLYFGILMKKARPDWDLTILERNPAGVTWGWGVVFSDETLEHFQEADRETHDRIVDTFARWESIDVRFKDRTIRSSGHVFCGIRRMRLLEILQERCRELGVDQRFETEVTDPAELRKNADLVVAADGVNSVIRTAMTGDFGPEIELGRSPYIWLATDKLFDAFTFIVRENEHGMFQVHAYRFDEETSTFIVETDEESWRRAKLDEASEAGSVAYLEGLFAPELGSCRLLSNKSSWIRFRRIVNRTWHSGNVVLIGDAAHTAHFSIGSGTKMAMEDSIALARALEGSDDLTVALSAYQEARWNDVARRQRAAAVSRHWFEGIGRYREFEPEQFTACLLTRSKRISHANLRLRDPAYVDALDGWFASRNGCEGQTPPPPMFTPYRLREMELENRVVVSPMCQYSAEDGTPDDWHLVHLGSRALGGASLVITEMTDVSREGRITPGCTGMYRPEHAAAWKRIVDFVHSRTRAKIAMQLAHAGRKGSTKLMWEGIDEPLPDGSWPLISASPIPWADGSQVPREMTRADMDTVRDDFVRAASMAIEAGFDMLELHFAHGYLLSSFISPLTNHRKDEYGGSLERRMRYPLEIFDAVRETWPEDRPISVRISATDWAPGGLEVDEAVAIGRMLARHRCDIIDVSSGMTTPMAKPIYGRMFQTPFADRIRNEAGIPTMAVGNIQNWDQVNTIIVTGRADLCVLARPHLFDPYLTLHAAADQGYHDIPWPDQYLPGKPRKR